MGKSADPFFSIVFYFYLALKQQQIVGWVEKVQVKYEDLLENILIWKLKHNQWLHHVPRKSKIIDILLLLSVNIHFENGDNTRI